MDSDKTIEASVLAFYVRGTHNLHREIYLIECPECTSWYRVTNSDVIVKCRDWRAHYQTEHGLLPEGEHK